MSIAGRPPVMRRDRLAGLGLLEGLRAILRACTGLGVGRAGARVARPAEWLLGVALGVCAGPGLAAWSDGHTRTTSAPINPARVSTMTWVRVTGG